MNATLKKRVLFITIGAALLGLYFLTRTINLTILPIFTDEAIYIRWSQIGANDANWRFISLTDGKQPLYTWLAMGSLRLFADPVYAGRMVSVGAGLLSLIGIAMLSFELFRSRRITMLSMMLYIVSPFALMYDRLALYDSLSTALSLWSFYFAVRLAKEVRLDLAMLLGLTLGFGMLNKTSGFLSLYMLPFTLILFPWKTKNRMKLLFQWGIYAVVAAGMSQMMYAMLRLSPFFHMISQKDSVFVYPVTQLFYTWRFFWGNLRGLSDWFIHYLTIPIVVTMIPAILLYWKKRFEILLVLLWTFLPFIALAYFGKVLYPRYILFMVIPLLMLSGITISWLLNVWKRQVRLYVLLGFIFFFVIRCNYYILFQPSYAPIPNADRGQLIDDWPSGWGIKEVNAIFQNEAQKGPIAVFTDGTFGLLPYAIEIYLVDNPNIFIQGIWPIPEEFPQAIAEQAEQKPTYLVFNKTKRVPPMWPVEKIADYQKGNNNTSFLTLYRVTPPIRDNLSTLETD